MAGTKLVNESDLEVTTGLPATWPNPITPELFAGKHQVQLAKAVGITQFGVNRVTLEPGSISALRHWHELEDEFVYVLSGELTTLTTIWALFDASSRLLSEPLATTSRQPSPPGHTAKDARCGGVRRLTRACS